MSKLFRSVALGALVVALPVGAMAQTTQALRVISNGQDVGYLKAETENGVTEVESHIDNNGRGPKLKLSIETNDAALPTSWTIQGTSLMGGDVNEWFKLEGDTASWVSQADTGEVTVTEPVLYSVNDGTAWDNYVYAKALLEDEDHTMPLLPAGELTLTEVTSESYGEGELETEVTFYRISGADSDGTLIGIDASGDFFALPNAGGSVVKEGYEDIVPQLSELAGDIADARAEEMAAKLTHRFEDGFAITNVRIFQPVEGTLSAPSTVYVEGERISAIEPYEIGKVYADDLTVFDGAGGTLLSGLPDMHSHSSLSSGLYYLAAGVTNLRDLGNNNDTLDRLIEKMDDGRIAGPRILSRGGFVEGKSFYSARTGLLAASEEEALEIVDWYAENGYDFIKTYNSMKPEWIPAVVERAKEHGMPIVGHVPAFSTADRQIEAGYDEITHANQLMLGWMLTADEDTRTPLRLTAMARGAELDLSAPNVQKTVQLMKENDVGLDTTAVILEMLMTSRAGEIPSIAEDYFDHMPISYQRYRKRSYVTFADDEAYEEYAEGFQRVLDTIKLLYDNDIRLLPGTDNGTGFTVHRELELYNMAGIPAEDVLKIATYDIANYLGYGDDLGSIEEGKYADFTLLPGNPIENIKTIKASRMVVRNGEVFYPAEIYKELNIKPFSAPPALLGSTTPAPTDTADASGIEFISMVPPGSNIDINTLPFSGATRVGDVFYFSGQIGGPNGGADDFRDDARQVMNSIERLADKTGAGMENVFKCTVMLDDISNWPAFNEVYTSYFTPGKMPARSAFAADALAMGATVEVECMAKAP